MRSDLWVRRWRGRLLVIVVGAAVFLPPWIGYLAVSLPDGHDSGQWRLAWVGFDVALLACLVAAGWLGVRRRRRAVPVLVATGTLMICDAWFDVVLSWPDRDWWISVLMAVLVELPLAVFLLVRGHLLLKVPRPVRTVSAGDIREVLTHPVRRRIMAQLTEPGVPAGTVAAAVGLEPDIVEHHLRELARLGFARTTGPAGDGTPGCWLPVGQDLRTPERDRIDPGERAVFDRWLQARAAQEVEEFTRVRARYPYPDEWHLGSRGGVRLTSAELAAFFADYLELLTWYGHRHDTPPPDARELAIRLYALPKAELDAP